MSNPYRIDGPAVISFSGGRTSGYMLRKILDAYDGALPEDVHILFANTGKEREETLEFVRDCETNWGARIHWLERGAEVAHATASRNGEPFAALIAERKFLPNPVTRYCTTELKIRPMKAWMLSRGYEHWTNVVGIRADEPRRVSKLRAGEGKDRWDVALPLADAGATEADILSFWAAQPFDLRLKSYEGNCDLCFLKGAQKRQRIMTDRPSAADWWIEQEERIKARFRSDTPSYRALLEATQKQIRMFDDADLADCLCHEGTTEAA